MGLTKKSKNGKCKTSNDGQRKNSNKIDFLSQLIDNDQINGVAEGIAKQVIDKGVNSMSENQKIVIDDLVDSYKKYNKCKMCSNGNIVYLTDYLFIAENGLCPMCENDKEIFMRD